MRSERMLIVVEGAECEPRYFNALRSLWRLSSILVKPCPRGTDPNSIVRFAKDALLEARSEKSPFKEVWVVFDHERHGDNPHLLQAINMAGGNSIRVALSNPSFEYWLIIHFEHTTSTMTSAQAAIAVLRRHLPHYDKAAYDADAIMPHVSIAIDHGARVRSHWQYHDIQRDGHPNPMTVVDMLTIALREMRRDR
jgi:hypothetical protein